MISAATVEIVTFFANIALTLSFIVAVIFGIAQIQAVTRDRRERFTLDVLRNFQTREFAELMNHTILREWPKTHNALRALPESEQVLFAQLAQQMESLGLIVSEKLIEVDLVDKTLGDFVVAAWEKYKPVFLDMRASQPDPFLGEYFQWLAELIAARMRSNARKPYYESAPR